MTSCMRKGWETHLNALSDNSTFKSDTRRRRGIRAWVGFRAPVRFGFPGQWIHALILTEPGIRKLIAQAIGIQVAAPEPMIISQNRSFVCSEAPAPSDWRSSLILDQPAEFLHIVVKSHFLTWCRSSSSVGPLRQLHV